MKVKFIKEIDQDSLDNVVIDLIGDGSGDEVVQELIIQVISGNNMTLKGKVMDDYTEYSVNTYPISAIRMSDMVVTSTLVYNNVYMIPTEGLSSIEIIHDANVHILVKAVG